MKKQISSLWWHFDRIFAESGKKAWLQLAIIIGLAILLIFFIAGIGFLVKNWFEYDLRCDGIILTVYGNSLEIHIGGMPDEQSKIKADELVEYIKSFEPKDIYYEAYYMDFESKEIFEIKNGKPFYRYEQLHLTEKEFVELYRKVYNLNDES